MSPQVVGCSPDRGRLILFIRNKIPRNKGRIFAHTYYANDLGEPMALNHQLKCIWIMLGIMA